MLDFQKVMKKHLAQRHIGRAMIGEVALKAVSDFFAEKECRPACRQAGTHGNASNKMTVQGFMKHDRLFIKTYNQAFKIALFRHQPELLEFVNKRIAATSYEQKVNKIICR